MPVHVATADLPYAPQQVFDVVADIEAYPRFLPHVAAARIARRDGNRLWVDQVIRFKLLRQRFATRAVLEPPSRISVVCENGPFGGFDEAWTFTPGPAGGTHVECRTEFTFRSRVMGAMLDGAWGEIVAETMAAFVVRCGVVYGGGSG